MHALLIHQAFISPNEAGGTRHLELGQRFVRDGHRFTIVASNLSYHTGTKVAPPDGGCEEYGGVEVRRAWTYPSLHRSYVWRVGAFVSFMISSVWTALRVRDVDLVIGTSPPIFQLLSAWIVSVLKWKPFVLEVRDLWPEFAVDMGVLKNPALIWAARRLERFLYSRATHFLVNSPAYREYLINKGVPAVKISFIANGVDTTLFDNSNDADSLREEFDLHDCFIVTYAGAMGQANDLDVVLDAAQILRSEPRIHFLMAGDGKECGRLQERAVDMKLPNVTFTGPLPKSEMPRVLAMSDACLATLKNIPMFRTTYPNKVFDYMAAARPTILGIDGVIRDVIEAAGGGVAVPPGDAHALADAVRELARDPERCRQMGRAARNYVCRHFNREQQAIEFRQTIEDVANRWAARSQKSFYRRYGKRLLDLSLTIPALLALAPILAVVALLVRFKLGSPVLFVQPRPGRGERLFRLCKFRTMTDARGPTGELLPDEQRLTRFGQFLRSSSLDELPELWNVLRGEMSLVGPRPLLERYLPLYSQEQARRHEVRPGLTGWAQVNGRNRTTWEDRLAMDAWYVDHCSLSLDLQILAKTVVAVLRRKDISAEGCVTMPAFTGSMERKAA